MRNKYGGIKRYRKQIFYPSFFHAAFVFIFVMGFWLGMASSAQAQGTCENYVLDFTVTKDAFAAIPMDRYFNNITVYLRIKPDPNAKTYQNSAILKFTDDILASPGSVKAGQGDFLIFTTPKNPYSLNFRVYRTATDFWEYTSSITLNPDWQFLAVSFNGSMLRIYRWEPGQGLNEGDTDFKPLGETIILGYTGYAMIGRLVNAWGGLADSVVIMDAALDDMARIYQHFSCGLTEEDKDITFGWYNFDGSQELLDEFGSGPTGWLGTDRNSTNGDPASVLECYTSAQTDIDADGVADGCDNCVVPSDLELSYNPAPQIDRDGDGFGDRCDKCPQFPNNTDSDGDGRSDPCEFIAQTGTHLDGFNVVSTTEFTGPNMNMLVADQSTVELICCKGDCIQEINGKPSIIWHNVLQSNCQYFARPAVSIYDDDDDGFGTPAGPGVKPVGPLNPDNNNFQEVSFDLRQYYTSEALAEITQCTTYYTNVHREKGYDPISDECLDDVCIDPTIVAAQILEGESNPDDTPVSFQTVTLDVKPCSTPSCFGMSGNSVVPVAIHSTSGFDAGLIDPSSVLLGIEGDISCEPRDSSISELPCAQGQHLIMHFEKSCLAGIGVGTETTELYVTGIFINEEGHRADFIGADSVCIQNE